MRGGRQSGSEALAEDMAFVGRLDYAPLDFLLLGGSVYVGDSGQNQSIGGVDIPEGGRVLLCYPSANRDEDVFVDPMTFDVRRADADKLLSFGVGAHFCLGAQFARRELRTMLDRLSRELTHVELTGEPEWAQSHFVSGVKHLPLAYSMR